MYKKETGEMVEYQQELFPHLPKQDPDFRYKKVYGTDTSAENDAPVEHIYPYASLEQVLEQALVQASQGKGKERHANEGEPFEKQVICEVRRRVGSGYTLGQAVKKIYESQRLECEAGVRELLGAIVYIAAEIIVAREEINGNS